jgi:flagellar motor switch protein FliG
MDATLMPEAGFEAGRILSGPEKAAALLLMIGGPPAARLMKHLDPPDLRSVARAAAGLGVVAATTLYRLVQDFAADFAAGAHLMGDVGQARSLFAEALPPNEVDGLFEPEPGDGDDLDVWQALAQTPDSAITALLTAERPATATYLLSKLDSPVAAKIVSALPRERRNAALCGLIAPHEVTPLAGQLIEDALRGILRQPKASSGGAEGRLRIAGIINNLDPAEAEDVMRAIGEAHPAFCGPV